MFKFDEDKQRLIAKAIVDNYRYPCKAYLWFDETLGEAAQRMNVPLHEYVEALENRVNWEPELREYKLVKPDGSKRPGILIHRDVSLLPGLWEKHCNGRPSEVMVKSQEARRAIIDKYDKQIKRLKDRIRRLEERRMHELDEEVRRSKEELGPFATDRNPGRSVGNTLRDILSDAVTKDLTEQRDAQCLKYINHTSEET